MAKGKTTHFGWGAEDIPMAKDPTPRHRRVGTDFRKLQGTSGLGPDVQKKVPVRFTTEAAGIDAPIRDTDPAGKYGYRGSRPELAMSERNAQRQHFQTGAPIEDVMREVYRQSPAMQVADQILGNFNRPPDEIPSLADLFIAATYTEPNEYKGRVRKAMTDVMLNYRLDMQKAHRFVLDDQFVEYATHVASVPADKLLNRIGAATLPYEHTWIEFNLRKKVETMRKIHRVNDTNMEDIAARAGLLLQRINDTDLVCTCVTMGNNGRVLPHLSAYFFTTREADFFSKELYRRHYGCIPFNFAYEEAIANKITREEGMTIGDFRDGLEQIGKATLWGYSKNATGMLPKDGPASLMVPPVLLHHGDAGYSRFYDAVKMGVDMSERQDFDKLHDYMLTELREFSGMMRWIVTVLAMLNEVPIHANLVQRPHRELRVDRLRKRKFLDYHKITLKIPKVKPIPYIERKLSHAEAQRRRAHEVRGHWRTYLQEGYCKRDEHEWVWDEENGYRLCGKCMSFSTFIREHVRGDPNLGWVRKDYHVEKARIP